MSAVALKVTQADVDAANALIGQTPTVVARALMNRHERDRGLAHGAILSKSRQALVVEARYDVICDLWRHFNSCGERKLSINKIAYILNLDSSSVWYALVQRGLK